MDTYVTYFLLQQLYVATFLIDTDYELDELECEKVKIINDIHKEFNRYILDIV